MKTFNKKAIIVLLLIAFGGGGCSDFVNLDPPTIVRQDQYYTSQADFLAAVNGLYASLRSVYNDFYAVAEIPSDNTEANGYTISLSVMDQMTWLENNGFIQNTWLSAFRNIAQSNIILSRIDGVAMEENAKKMFKAEAKFIRALMYFNLVQFFGDVPLVLTEIKTEEEAYSYLREPMATVYDQIETDLSDAISVLPLTHSSENVGRATKGAAQGLLAKVYVTQQQFDAALPLLAELTGSGTYDLLPDYAQVFNVANKNNSEMLFSVQYLGNGNGEGSNFSISFAPFGSGTEITSGGNPRQANQGTRDLWDAFEPDDLRKPVAIAEYAGTGARYTRKFMDRPTAENEGNNNWPLLRYADILLLYAEALNETGRSADALAPLNQVRGRAGLEPLSETNQGILRHAIQKERRVELCFEGHRWFDLNRTETMVPVMEAYVEKYLETGYQVEFYEVDENKALFPVPFRERNLNPNLTQNEGYN